MKIFSLFVILYFGAISAIAQTSDDNAYLIELVLGDHQPRVMRSVVSTVVEKTTDLYVKCGITYTISNRPAYLLWKSKELYVMTIKGWILAARGENITYKSIVVGKAIGEATRVFFDIDGREFKALW